MDGPVFRDMTRSEIAAWYHTEFAEAFAENERKPLADILSLMREGRYELRGLFDGARLLGYAALWKRSGVPLVLLDYLGVTAERRNEGLGTQLLALLRETGLPLVTESELPVPGGDEAENALRVRRLAFYRRSGFSPAYEMATCGMRWQALVINTEGLALEDVMRWHRELYGPERTDVRIPLERDEIPALPYWMKQQATTL